MTAPTVLSDAAGRMRVQAPWFRSSQALAVALEDDIEKIPGVRAVHAYPRTASVVVWYSPKRCDTATILDAIANTRDVAPAALTPYRAPHSADVGNADVARMALGGIALLLLGSRRYVFGRPALLGPTSRVVVTGATIITGYPFLRGALRALRGGQSAGTDLLVSAATVASLILRRTSSP